MKGEYIMTENGFLLEELTRKNNIEDGLATN